MKRRWTVGAALAVVVAIVTAISVSNARIGGSDVSFTVGAAPISVEIEPASQTVRITLSF